MGDFHHLAGSNLAIDLGGLVAGEEFDRLMVDGATTLAGDLEVTLVDLGEGIFDPTLGDVFELINATDGVSGQFDAIMLPGLAQDLKWHVEYLSNSVELLVLSSADFDSDGDVDSADLTFLQGAYGLGSLLDADGDGDTDGADYLAWQRQYTGQLSTLSGSSVVPEPSSFALLCLMSVLSNKRVRCFVWVDQLA